MYLTSFIQKYDSHMNPYYTRAKGKEGFITSFIIIASLIGWSNFIKYHYKMGPVNENEIQQTSAILSRSRYKVQ